MTEKKRKMSALIFLVALLVVYDVLMILGYLYFTGSKIAGRYSTENIQMEVNSVVLDSLTLRQKLAQMIIVSGRRNSAEITRMNVGGIYLFGDQEREWYAEKITKFEGLSRLKLFFSTDLEGYWNPFQGFYNSTVLGSITNVHEAFLLGKEHGMLLHDLGFTMNFAPVTEADGPVWPGRGWNGSSFEIAELSRAYVRGLQGEGVMSVVKHYPGGSLASKDPHKTVVEHEIHGEELFPFLIVLQEAKGVMAGHVVTSGEIDSRGKPCSVSRVCIESIRKSGFEGLIVTDEVNMQGLKEFYSSKEEMYGDLINAGSDVILDFSLTPRGLDKLLMDLEKKVHDGEISEERIDESMRRILKAKGYEVA